MKLILKDNILKVLKEKGDKRITGGRWGTKESHLLNEVKKSLKEQYDITLVKVRAEKDGHLWGDSRSVILRPPIPQTKELRLKGKENIGVFHGGYMLRCAGDIYNKEGMVMLNVMPTYWLGGRGS